MMVTTQSFRLLGKPDIEDITCEEVNGQNVIFWQDIEQVFPGAKYIKCGATTINLMRDMNRQRIVPHCIKHYPRVVLDIILSTPGEDDTTDPAAVSNLSTGCDETNGGAGDPASGAPLASTSPFDDPPRPPPAFETTALNDAQASGMTVPSASPLESETDRQLYTSLLPDIQAHTQSSLHLYRSFAHVLWHGQMELSAELNTLLMTCFQGLRTSTDQLTELQRALEAKQTQHLGQSILFRHRLQGLLSKTYELYEHPIPRLFIVLPQDSRRWNSRDPLSNKFRLYFLCDCGEHTKATNSRISHRIHLAKHRGYDIAQPKEFFQLYGSYVLLILKMLKFGISVAGVEVPALTQLVHADAMDQATKDLEMLTDTIGAGLNQVIECIEKVSPDESNTVIGLSGQMGNNDPLDGADLRQLETFLKKDKSNVLGDLYRMVTASGYVHWVCIEHYREMYPEQSAKALDDTAKSLQGSFDESSGCVKVKLESREEAEWFYLALEKTDAVCELNINLDWDTTRSDFKRMQETIMKTNIGVLGLNLNNKIGPTRDSLNHSRRHDPVFDMMRHSSISSVTIVQPPSDFIQQSSLQSCNDGFPNLRHLDLDMEKLVSDIAGVKDFVAKVPRLSSLILRNAEVDFLQVYNAVAGDRTYPFAFQTPTIRILPWKSELHRPLSVFKDLTDLFQDIGGRIETLELSGENLNGSTIEALAQATAGGSRLKELALVKDNQRLGDKCIQDIASIIARSALRKLDIRIGMEEERVRALESIQWKHIRELAVRVNRESQGVSAMKALVDGVKKVSGEVDLERFVLYSTVTKDISKAQEEVLRSFVDSVSLKHLHLDVGMSPEQALSLFESVGLSQLEHFTLWTSDYHPHEVEIILGHLPSSTQLKRVTLVNAAITEEQTERMKSKGVTLSVQ